MSSAIYFNFDQSKILSFGKELNYLCLYYLQVDEAYISKQPSCHICELTLLTTNSKVDHIDG